MRFDQRLVSARREKQALHPPGEERQRAATGLTAYLSKRLRRQGQTKGALTNTKALLVSILKNATFF